MRWRVHQGDFMSVGPRPAPSEADREGTPVSALLADMELALPPAEACDVGWQILRTMSDLGNECPIVLVVDDGRGPDAA